MFAIEVQALGAGRYIGLTMSSVLMLLYIYVSIHDIESGHKQAQMVSRGEVEQKKRSSVYNSPRMSTSSGKYNPKSMRSTTTYPSILSRGASPITAHQESPILYAQPSIAGSRRPKRRRWSVDVDPMFVGVVICQIMVFTYFVVSTELFLKRNPSTSNGATQWGFGQILALIVITPSALSAISALTQHGFRRLSKRRKDGVETESVVPELMNSRQGTELSSFNIFFTSIQLSLYITKSYHHNSLC